MVDGRFHAAAPHDMDLLLPMMEELWAIDAVPYDRERSRRACLRLMAEPQAGGVWLIRAAARVGGYLVLTHSFSLEFGGWHAFIDELFVAEFARGRGLGSAAVAFAADYCSERGMEALLLEADLHNAEATRLYRRLGFGEHRRRLMSLRIPS